MVTRRVQHGEMVIITVNIPEVYLKHIQKLMDFGIANSRSEYVRHCVRNQVARDLLLKEAIEDFATDGPSIPKPRTQEEKDNEFLETNGIKIIRRLEY